MKTIALTALPPEIAADITAGEAIRIMQDDRIVGMIEPGDPFVILEQMRELFKDVSEEELIAQTELALRR